VSDDQVKIIVAGTAATATILAVVIGVLANYLSTRTTRRRSAYAEALKAVVAWSEMPYRVSRRSPEDTAALVERFHELQQDLAYYRGLLGSESKYIERSYARLVRNVKEATQAPIKAAWAVDLGQLADRATEAAEDADASTPQWSVDPDVSAFLGDVRRHLSPWPWRRWALAWRNRKSQVPSGT
jgi:hypothetical protein